MFRKKVWLLRYRRFTVRYADRETSGLNERSREEGELESASPGALLAGRQVERTATWMQDVSHLVREYAIARTWTQGDDSDGRAGLFDGTNQ